MSNRLCAIKSCTQRAKAEEKCPWVACSKWGKIYLLNWVFRNPPNRISKSAKYRICITTIANSIYLWPNVGSSWWPGPKTYNYWSEIQRENSIKTNTTRIFKWQNYIWWVAPIFNAVKSNVSGIPCCPLCCSYKYGYGVSVNKMNLWNCKSSDTMKYSQLCPSILCICWDQDS